MFVNIIDISSMSAIEYQKILVRIPQIIGQLTVIDGKIKESLEDNLMTFIQLNCIIMVKVFGDLQIIRR